MQNPIVSESPTKQETISRQRRERAKSDSTDDIYVEEVIQKKMLVEEPAETETSDMMLDEGKPSKSSSQNRTKKARATSLTVIKNTPANSFHNPLESFNKRDLIPLSLQKQLNGSRRNKKLSLDESISKLKTPSGKSLAKNIDKMRFLSAVQQQEIEAIIRAKNSFHSSNSGSQLSSPLVPVSNRDSSVSPQNILSYNRNTINPNPSHFSRFSDFTTDYNPSAESDVMSDTTRDQMKITDQQKIEYSLSNQNNTLEPNINHQQPLYTQNPTAMDLQGQGQFQVQWLPRIEFPNLDLNSNSQNGGQMNNNAALSTENYHDEGNFTSSFNIYNQTQSFYQQQQLSFMQQQQLLQQQIPPHVANQMKVVRDSPKSSFYSHSQITPDKSCYSNFTGDYSSPSRKSFAGEQEPNYEQNFTNLANAQTNCSNMINSTKFQSSNPKMVAEEQLKKIGDYVGKNPDGTPTSSKSNRNHKRSSSFTSLAQEKLNMVSNLNTLQLQSNLVPEKFVASPLQGLSPSISRTNTDPSQLKNLIRSMREEKQAVNNPTPNDYLPQNDPFLQGGDVDDAPPLKHTAGESWVNSGGALSLMHTGTGSLLNSGGGGSLMHSSEPPLIHTGGGGSFMNPGNGSLSYLEDNSCYEGGSLLHTGGGGSLLHTGGGASLLHTGGGRGGFGSKPKAEPAWDPFVPSITTSKTDNTDIKNYILSKTNPNYLNSQPSNFKTANFPSKPHLKPQNYQPEDPQTPLVTRTKTDPNDVKDLIKSFRNKGTLEPTSPFNIRTRNESSLPLQNFTQATHLNNDQLYSNPNFFGQSPRSRINTNPDHLASLIKSVHENKNSTSPRVNQQFASNADFPFPRSDNSHPMKAQQLGFPVINLIPSLGDLEVQNPITRTNTDPTDWRSLIRGNKETKASQFAHHKTNNLSHASSHASQNPSQTHLNGTLGSLGTPVFNQETNIDFNTAANFPFGLQQQQPQQSNLNNPMGIYRARTDPTSIRAIINSNNQNREEQKLAYIESANSVSEDGRSITGIASLGKKFGKIQVQSSTNTLQSDIGNEDQSHKEKNYPINVDPVENAGFILPNTGTMYQQSNSWANVDNLLEPSALLRNNEQEDMYQSLLPSEYANYPTITRTQNQSLQKDFNSFFMNGDSNFGPNPQDLLQDTISPNLFDF